MVSAGMRITSTYPATGSKCDKTLRRATLGAPDQDNRTLPTQEGEHRWQSGILNLVPLILLHAYEEAPLVSRLSAGSW